MLLPRQRMQTTFGSKALGLALDPFELSSTLGRASLRIVSSKTVIKLQAEGEAYDTTWIIAGFGGSYLDGMAGARLGPPAVINEGGRGLAKELEGAARRRY